MKVILFIILEIFCIVVSYASHRYELIGAKFTEGRKYLLSQGWTPQRMHVKNEYTYIGIEKELIKKRFYEVESCSVDNQGLCIFNYVQDKKCLRITTSGEQIRSMKIIDIDDQCLGSNRVRNQ